MDSAVKLIQAIGGLAWPAVVLVIAVMILRRHRGAVDRLFQRTESAKLPGGIELVFSTVEERSAAIDDAVNNISQAVEVAPEEVEAALSDLQRVRDALKETVVNLRELQESQIDDPLAERWRDLVSRGRSEGPKSPW